MGEGECQWLHERAKEMNSIVEIGSLLGRSAMALLSGCRGTVYCIDPWNDNGDNGWSMFISNVGHFTNLVPIRGFSPSCGSLVHGDIDMVFIDGDHNYESCNADLEFWFPRTKILICGHDYTHPTYPGVKASVDDFFGKRNMSVEVADGTSIWHVRIP